jgi:hypothetical protein
MPENQLLDPDLWCSLSFLERRALLATTIRKELGDTSGVTDVTVEAGSLGREYDLTVVVDTDAGKLRTPLWSHARATIFCDPSVHPANRRQLAPSKAVAEAVDRLKRRLNVPYSLESRGLTFQLAPENGVERSWTAERSLFRNRTAVTREDRVLDAAPDLDVRDLLAHFYVGPSLRLIGADGEAFVLPAAVEAEGPLISLCAACSHWAEGAVESCPSCGGPVDVVIAARPPKR